MSVTGKSSALFSGKVCTYLRVQAQKIKYIIYLTETRRHQSRNAIVDTREGMFHGTHDDRGVGGVGVLVNTNLA